MLFVTVFALTACGDDFFQEIIDEHNSSEENTLVANDENADVDLNLDEQDENLDIDASDDAVPDVDEPAFDVITPDVDDVDDNSSDLEEPLEEPTEIEVDVDLTTLSSTMVFAEVYNIVMDPTDYIGKTVKMSGTFARYDNPDNGDMFFAVVIMDATACCAQGLEFVVTDDYVYPDDYPSTGDEITVIGEFELYTYDTVTYFRVGNGTFV